MARSGGKGGACTVVVLVGLGSRVSTLFHAFRAVDFFSFFHVFSLLALTPTHCQMANEIINYSKYLPHVVCITI